MSRTAKACLLLGGAFALLALAWMALLPAVAEHELRAVTGFEFRMEVLTVNPFTGSVVVRGLSARNPAGYPEPDFVEMRALTAQVGVFSCLFSRQVVIDYLYLDVAKVELVRQHNGRTNAGEFVAAFRRWRAAPAGAPAPGKPAGCLIRKLHVHFDRLVVEDHTGSKPDENSYDLHIDQEFTNVSGPAQLLVPSVVRNLHSFGLHHDVKGLLPGEFGDALAVAVGGAATMGGKLEDATVETGKFLKGAIGKLEQRAKP